MFVWTAGILALSGNTLACDQSVEQETNAGAGGRRDDLYRLPGTYVPRVCMMCFSGWSELQFLFQFAGRYHVLPLIGLAAILSTVIAGWPLIRHCDSRQGRPAFAGAILGVSDARGSIQTGQLLGFLSSAARPGSDIRCAGLPGSSGPRRRDLSVPAREDHRSGEASLERFRPGRSTCGIPAGKAHRLRPNMRQPTARRRRGSGPLEGPTDGWRASGARCGYVPVVNPPQPDPHAQIVAVARAYEVHAPRSPTGSLSPR